jgi:hypothetical protein
MTGKRDTSDMSVNEDGSVYGDFAAALSPFKQEEWIRLSPGERITRSWNLRTRIADIQAVHDRKLFPKP